MNAPHPDTGVIDAGSGIHLLPTLHQTVEFAVLVRRAFYALRPAVVALELPRTLETAFLRAVTRLPLLSVVLYPDGDETVYLVVEPHEAMVEGARLALENGLPVAFVDRDDGTYPLVRTPAPDAYALTRLLPGDYVSALLEAYPASTDARDLARDRAMAFHLTELAKNSGPVLWIGGAAHVHGILAALEEPQAQPFGRVSREGVRILSLAHTSSREVMSEMPYVSASYERARQSGGAFTFDSTTDTQRVLDRLLKEAAERYQKDQKAEVSRTALQALRKFSRNLAFVQGVLTPSFYDLIVAARGTVDDDFAWHVFDLAATWPWPDATHSLPEITLSGDDVFLEGRKVRFQRRFPGKGDALRRLPIRNRPKEKKAGDWKKVPFGNGICSYPPEDLAIERFGNHLREKATRMVNEETRRVSPLTGSLLDGIDVKETMRRLHEGRLWVYEERRSRGGTSSVVVIFDEDESAYPWRTTWTGEHGQESDMAFYATPLGETFDGPGISRCEYGGFLMTFPPGRLYDVFHDPDYRNLQHPREVLLAAALDYALEPRVVHVAKEPPRPAFRHYAARLGKKIVHVPIGSLSPPTIARLRKFHVLANRAVRGVAKDYLG